MRIYKRGEYWWCSFTWQSRTIRKSTRCTTRTAALLVAQRWERERADPVHAAASAATVGGAVSAFLESLAHKKKADGTKKMYRQKCGVLVRHLGADSPLNETVTAPRIDQFISERGKEPVAFDKDGHPTRFVTANTIHKELVALRQVLKHARRRKEFTSDPATVLPVGFSPNYVPRTTTLTPEQAVAILRQLVKHGNAAHRAASIAWAAATTARHKEVRNARPGDVRGDRVHLRGTKTEGSNRTVTVPPFALPLLQFGMENAAKGDLLFPKWGNARRALEHACKAVGAPRVTWNDLRRTMSTWLLEGGASLYAVSKVLGHKTTKMLQTVYGQPSEDAVGELVARQTAALPPVPTVELPTNARLQAGQRLLGELDRSLGDQATIDRTTGVVGSDGRSEDDGPIGGAAEQPGEATTEDMAAHASDDLRRRSGRGRSDENWLRASNEPDPEAHFGAADRLSFPADAPASGQGLQTGGAVDSSLHQGAPRHAETGMVQPERGNESSAGGDRERSEAMPSVYHRCTTNQSETGLTGTTQSEHTPDFPAENSGPSGNRTRDLRIKRPEVSIDNHRADSLNADESADDVPPVYTSRSVSVSPRMACACCEHGPFCVATGRCQKCLLCAKHASRSVDDPADRLTVSQESPNDQAAGSYIGATARSDVNLSASELGFVNRSLSVARRALAAIHTPNGGVRP